MKVSLSEQEASGRQRHLLGAIKAELQEEGGTSREQWAQAQSMATKSPAHLRKDNKNV